jgi:hypothetical protein
VFLGGRRQVGCGFFQPLLLERQETGKEVQVLSAER